MKQVYLKQNFSINRKTFEVLIEIQFVHKNRITLQASQTLLKASFNRTIYDLIYLNFLEPYQNQLSLDSSLEF